MGIPQPPQDWINELFFIVKAKKSVVIVEGKNDKKVLGNCVKQGVQVKYYSGNVLEGQNNKALVIQSVKELSKDTASGLYIIGIVDADFNRITNKLQNLRGLFYTDAHDLDAQIFSSPAFDKFLHFCFYDDPNSPIKIPEIRNICVTIAKDYGYYRFALEENDLRHLKTRFEDIVAFINDQFTIATNWIENELTAALKIGNLSPEQKKDFLQTVSELKKQQLDPYQLANGHDLIKVFVHLIIKGAKGLRKERMSENYRQNLENIKNSRNLFTEDLENYLRGFFEKRWLEGSKLCSAIKQYQADTGIVFID